MAITFRSTKGSALTHVEMDNNFRNLDGRIIDSDGIITIINNNPTGIDSAQTISLIDSDYIQARQTSVVPASGVDSAQVISIVDSDYVQARQTVIDSDYVALRTPLRTDSSAVTTLIDSDYIQERQTFKISTTPITYEFTITNDSAVSYIFADSAGAYFPVPLADPVLYLRRGEKYILNNSSPVNHPMVILDSENGTEYILGVQNNGNASGNNIEFTPSMSAPSTLYYKCSVHSGMGNTINIV